MSASLPVHATTPVDIWKLVETHFGLDQFATPLSRPSKESWLAQFRKQVPRAEAVALTQAWMLRLFWLRRMELWLIETHQDSSYGFLDVAHLHSLGDIKALLDGFHLAKEDRNYELNHRFPLLPALPIPVWFSNISVINISIEKGLGAIREVGLDELEVFGKQMESPASNAAHAACALPGNVDTLLNPFALDASLETGQIHRKLKSLKPEKNYRVAAGPGGYKRALPDEQDLWELTMQSCHDLVGKMFILAPDVLAADRWQYHMALACVQAMHVCRGEAFVLSPLPAFHSQIRIGDGLQSNLDTRLSIEALLPDQPVRLGLWRTALGRFHRAKTIDEREEARHLLDDLPRNFRAPLRPEGPAWRHLQRLLKLEQESQSLFSIEPIPPKLQEHIEQARQEFRKSNLSAFEWRYAFPEVLNAKTADFQGFSNMQLLLPEELLEKQEHLLLAWVQLAWKLIKPGGILVLWLPDDIMRWRKVQPAFQWMEKTGRTIEKQYCGGDSFVGEITGKQIFVWRKNE